MGHTYTLELRFSGDQLDPSEISTRLGLRPSNMRDQVQCLESKRNRHPFWSYDGHGEANFQAEWESLEVAFEFLLGCLYEKKMEIKAIANQFQGLWWCGHFQSSFSGGPTLSPKVLLEVGSYGIPLSIDNYFSDDTS